MWGRIVIRLGQCFRKEYLNDLLGDWFMNILIICTYFPPDTVIASVRPYMFAKYLYKYGHNVTVLCSGNFYCLPDNFYSQLDGVDIIYYNGDDCDTAKFFRGEYINKSGTVLKRKGLFSWKAVKRIFSVLYGFFISCKIVKRAIRDVKLQKKSLREIADRKFDVIFSSYGDLSNIYAGKFAKDLFNAKWVMDFRDPVTLHCFKGMFLWNMFAKKVQFKAVQQADACTSVSSILSGELRKCCPTANVFTLYNGYDDYCTKNDNLLNKSDNILKIVYTGTMYDGRCKALCILAKCLCLLIKSGKVNKRFIQFHYAGIHSQKINDIFEEYSISEILCDHGYVNRNTVINLQKMSDIFLVLSWNTTHQEGVLTGKFYEGIRSSKHILSVLSGNLANSELKMLNIKYNYGFCCEEACDGDFEQMTDWIHSLYEKKQKGEKLLYSASNDLSKNFRYDNITLKLIEIMDNLLEGKDK